MDNSFFSSHVMNDSISKIKTNKYKTKTLPYLKNKKKKIIFSLSSLNKNKINLSHISTTNITNSSQKDIFNDVIKKRKTHNYINLKKIKSASNIINKKLNITDKTINLIDEKKKSQLILNKTNFENEYNRIVLNRFKKNKREFIPNQFNILYCENQKQFNLFENYKNRRRIEKGKLAIHHIINNKDTNSKINYIKDSINKINGILNYSYPKIFLHKYSDKNNNKEIKIKMNKLLNITKKENKFKNNSEIIDPKLIYKL